ncbi:MAG: THUMP domain-containing protein [Bacteriovorax sp.]
MQNENIDATTEALTTLKTPPWNVLITLRGEGMKEAKRSLRQFGAIHLTDFFNVLVMHVEDIDEFLHDFAFEFLRRPYLKESISRVAPVMRTFNFNSREEFENKAKQLAGQWPDRIAGKTFYVRMHRRGFKESMKSLVEEQFLDRYILKSLQERGESAMVSFTDPDFIIDVESLNNQAGLSIWSRDDLLAFPFLNLD